MTRIGIFILISWVVFAQSCMFFRTSDKKAEKEFAQKGVSITSIYQEVNGYNMHYLKTGADTMPTLFFIHGSPGSWDAFKAYLYDSNLLNTYRMISIDRPGFGYSNFGEAKNLSSQSLLIQPILQSIQNDKPCYIVGHSLGGPMAVRLAIDAPQLISGIVLIAGSIDPDAETGEKWRKLFIHAPLRYLLPGAFEPSNQELWMLKDDLKTLKTDLKLLDKPVYIVHGKKDVMVPFSNVAFAQKQFPKLIKDTLIFEDANHFIPWTRFNEIKDFLLALSLE